MKKLLILVVLAAYIMPVSAQKRSCSSHEHYLEQVATDPLFAKRQRDIEQFTEQYEKTSGSITSLERGTPLYKIPVIVHVVYSTLAENISDAQIQSQIDALNKDYQLLNSDSWAVPGAFKLLVADCRVQFCLAQRDPFGNATTGIIRKQTTKTSFTDNDNVKHSSTGGDNAWDADNYLNLWVCKLGGGLLGYAQFPGGPAATDGVVINYTAFGTTGAAAPPFNLGRTTTHEIGHWLNLQHIWGDDGTACTRSDGVYDTPNQGGPNYNCPTFPSSSCNNGSNGDMFMNYMDYVNDACMMMFTPGQRNRMYAVLAPEGTRGSLASSLGCTPPSTSECLVPTGVTATDITQTTSVIKWDAVPGAVSYTLQYKAYTATTLIPVTGITTTSYTLTNLAPGTTYKYKVRANCIGSSGNYCSVKVFTTLLTNGCTDLYENNNTIATAAPISANSTVSALISSSADKDYFAFTNSAVAPNIKVTLDDLPADYDVKLYSPSGTLVRTGQNTGHTAENLKYNTSVVGTYKVFVYGYSGAFNFLLCYKLTAKTSNILYREAPEDAIAETGVSVYPVPAFGYINISLGLFDIGKADIIIMNAMGAVVLRRPVAIDGPLTLTKLDVSTLTSGVYFMRVIQGKRNETVKVVISR